MTSRDRLAGIDANFLYSETPTQLLHTLKIAIFERPKVPGLYSRIKYELQRRLHLLPGFTRRAVHVPFDLHHPVWVEDPHFDLDRHVHSRHLLAPGTPAQLDGVIAEIAQRALPRDRPLWELWIVDGLEGERVAAVCKLHHAMADGMAAAEMLRRLALPLDALERAAGRAGHILPSRPRLTLDALKAQPGRARRFARLLGETAKAGAALRRGPETGQDGFPRPFSAPRTLFNRTLPKTRAFATTRLDMARIKEVKNALGVTVNDVVMALATEATHAYLRRAGERPDKPLVASVPVSTAGKQPAGGAPAMGNHLSNLLISLDMSADTAVERLHAIRRSTRAAMSSNELLGKNKMAAWAEYTPGRPFSKAMQMYSRYRLADRHTPPVNLVISNVRGPGEPLTIAGARLAELYSVGPVLEGIGLNLTAWSYAGYLSVAALAHGALPLDLHLLTDDLHTALDELSRGTSGATRAPPPARRAPARAARTATGADWRRPKTAS